MKVIHGEIWGEDFTQLDQLIKDWLIEYELNVND